MNELEHSLIRWAQAGLVGVDQARRIRDFEQSDLPESDDFGVSLLGQSVDSTTIEGVSQPAVGMTADKPDRSAIATEAVAYIGGMLFLIGYGVLLGTQWERMNGLAHFLVVLVPAMITFVAGLGFGKQTVESFRRVGYALWALSTGFAAFATGIAFGEFVEFSDNVSIAGVASITAAYAVTLFVFRRSAIQQLLAFLAIAFFTSSMLWLIDEDIPMFWYGALVATQGLVWLLFTWADVIRPKRDGIIQGAGAALIAIQVMVFSMSDPALVIGMVVGLIFIIAGVLTSTTVLFTIGSIGLFIFAYESVLSWFGSSVLTNSILLIVGVLVLGAVVVRLQLKGRS